MLTYHGLPPASLHPAVDLVSLYPRHLTPDVLLALRSFYIETYQDKLFTEPHAWGKFYIIMEAVYSLPVSIWAVFAINKGD